MNSETGSGSAPRISVVMPVYNREHLLGRAIRSVLAQTESDFEFLIVDDGSTDRSREVALSFDDARIRLLAQPKNAGCAAARNAGIKAAKGTYIAFQDSDDQWIPGHLEALLSTLNGMPDDIGFAYGGIVRVINNSPTYRPHKQHLRQLKSQGITEAASILDLVIRHGVGYVQTWLVRRACFDAVGLFDEQMPTSSDWDMLVRLALRYNGVFVPGSLSWSERYEDSLSHVGTRHSEMMAHVLKKLEADPRVTTGQRMELRYQVAKSHFIRGRWRQGFALLAMSCRERPFHPVTWRMVGKAVMHLPRPRRSNS